MKTKKHANKIGQRLLFISDLSELAYALSAEYVVGGWLRGVVADKLKELRKLAAKNGGKEIVAVAIKLGRLERKERRTAAKRGRASKP